MWNKSKYMWHIFVDPKEGEILITDGMMSREEKKIIMKHEASSLF